LKNRYFIITSHGWSASNWLAYVLNKNPKMLVTHSAANLHDKKLENDINSNIKEFHKGYLNRQLVSIDETYNCIESYGKAEIYGSVHLYRLRDIPYLYTKFGISKRNFIVINLIRNPIDLVWSGYGQFKELFKTDINELFWTLGKVVEDKEYLYSVADKYNIKLGEYKNLSFIGAARVLGSLKLDFDVVDKVNNIPFIDYYGEIKMEDITTQRNALLKLVKMISGNDLMEGEKYINEVFSIGKINAHQKNKKKLSNAEIFNQFTDWQKEVFLYYARKYNIIDQYCKWGYDLSFLK
jgi:hypothetical protein